MNEKTNIQMQLQLQDGIWKLERYGIYEGNGWNDVKTQTYNMYLILKNMSLMLTHDDTLIEHISFLSNNVRMVLKQDSLGIAIIHDGLRMRKIRVKFARTNIHSAAVLAKNCVEVLGKYVKIEDLSNTRLGNKINDNYDSVRVSLSQYVSEILNKHLTDFCSDDKELTSLYPLEDIIDVCILDHEFPTFVAEVHNLLSKKLK